MRKPWPSIFMLILLCGACSSETGANSGPDANSPDGVPPVDGKCQGNAQLIYREPGCGAAAPAPRCVTAVGLCLSYACSCEGKIISGCHAYSVPYSNVALPPKPSQFADAAPEGTYTVGEACGPNGSADAAAD